MLDVVLPFTRAYQTGSELNYLARAVERGHLSGDGPFTQRATALITRITQTHGSLLTTSCTHALEMTALLLDLEPGDEVIMPSFTFVSTANAYALRGALPVFVDCHPDTLNLDETQLEAAITDRTKAIVVVHYAGVACEMDAITAIARKYNLVVIEDNAHGLGGSYKGKTLGSFGDMAAQSFHVSKNVQCGEGGAFVTTNQSYLERAEIIREKGTNRSQFFRGTVDKYRWLDYGSSYLPSELNAAYLTAQLEHFDSIQQQRHHVWDTYHSALKEWAINHGVSQPVIPSHSKHPAHIYFLLMPSPKDQQAFLKHLARRGVQGTFHYVPLHSAPAGEKLGRTATPDGCPVTDDVWARLIRLPLYAGLTQTELELVVEATLSYRP